MKAWRRERSDDRLKEIHRYAREQRVLFEFVIDEDDETHCEAAGTATSIGRISMIAKRVLVLSIFLLTFCVVPTHAQEAADRTAKLQAQLADIQGQQTELQSRLAQVDEDIKPENIEKSLAGVGSTHPEDLREARRRQLEIQRKGIQTQLDTLTVTRQRLEAAIASSEAESYRQMVGPAVTSLPNSTSKASTHPHRQRRRLKRKPST
jgi:hypothetical protein